MVQKSKQPLGMYKIPLNNGIFYMFDLCRISSINSMTYDFSILQQEKLGT